MASEQLEWVFDALVEFLRGPIWNIPVLTFIEQKSVGKFEILWILIKLKKNYLCLEIFGVTKNDAHWYFSSHGTFWGIGEPPVRSFVLSIEH